MADKQKSVSSQRVSNPPTRDANAAQRVALAVKLRASKMTYDAIAKQCGYGSASACRKAVQRELDRVVVTNVDTLRREEMTMLDSLQVECMKLALDKENKGRLFAIDRILAISDRRCKLMGLDKRPEEDLTQQAYTKKIVLMPSPTGNQDHDTNS